MPRFCVSLLICLLIQFPCLAHDEPRVEEVKIAAPVADVASTLLIPHAHAKIPCVVILGGSMSHTRDGEMIRAGVPKRDALKRLAEDLLARGYASLRFDRVGFGASKPNSRWMGNYSDEASAATAVIQYARQRKEFDRIVVVGESAGAYFACLAAKDGVQADAYIFLGALSASGPAMYEHTFGGLVKWAESSPERMEWAKKNVRFELGLGRHFNEMYETAAKGADVFQTDDDGLQLTVRGLNRRREELKWPPDEMFKHIQAPALALSGERDLNCPPATNPPLRSCGPQATNMRAANSSPASIIAFSKRPTISTNG